MKRRSHRRLVIGLLAATVTFPALVGGATGTLPTKSRLVENGTTPESMRYFMQHPNQAPGRIGELVRTSRSADSRHRRARPSEWWNPLLGRVFNRDTFGLPQNEESISTCASNTNVLLGATNDYRGLVDPEGNFTGWSFSNGGERTLTNEGLLPPVAGGGKQLPSGGDPVAVVDDTCTPYAASLNYLFTGSDFSSAISGVGVYRSSTRTLSTCPRLGAGGVLTHRECWPVRRNLDLAAPGHFLDKEWMDVGRSGSAGKVVWVAYGDLSQFNEEGNEESGVIKAVRCSGNLTSCTRPIVLSRGQRVAEYPDVTIGPDGRTYITWGEFFGESFIGPTQQAWIAVAEPGSTTFTRHRIYREDQVMRGHETLHAADFRTGTMFKNAVAIVNGHPRVFVTWERCRLHAVDQVCEEPEIVLTHSDDLGRTWSDQRVVSAGGDNYFPTIDVDESTGRTVMAWYTHRFDPVFHHRQDVELATFRRDGRVVHRQRVTKMSNEPDADPLLTGFFIGDYFEVSAAHHEVFVHFNANARHVALLGDGVPVPQQDNYLKRVHE